MRTILIALLGLSGLLSTPASSEGLSGSLSLVTNYKSRGQDQTKNQPAIQGGIENQWASGFFVGNWNSSVSWSPEVSVETDVYGGYRGNRSGIAYEFGFFRYGYPGFGRADTLELNASVGLGGVVLRYSQSVSSRFFTYDTRANYFNLSFMHMISESVSFAASAGRTNYRDNAAADGLPDFIDFRIGAAKKYSNGLNLTIDWAGANRTDAHGLGNKPRLIAGLGRSF
jgi:uncharacterized protein (TIGR02001 family)